MALFLLVYIQTNGDGPTVGAKTAILLKLAAAKGKRAAAAGAAARSSGRAVEGLGRSAQPRRRRRPTAAASAQRQLGNSPDSCRMVEQRFPWYSRTSALLRWTA
uniref:Uncharacterized protein n=1 Tax=Leersia perrieri TaxID=77586 RepID=A0A0D9XXV8_9ORYZ